MSNRLILFSELKTSLKIQIRTIICILAQGSNSFSIFWALLTKMCKINKKNKSHFRLFRRKSSVPGRGRERRARDSLPQGEGADRRRQGQVQGDLR